jgi:DNA polymerase-3 subunit alpha
MTLEACEELLKDTTTQEQVMLCLKTDFSKGDADVLRKGWGKAKVNVLIT